ncbi:MAG: PepSY-associated TM helix domain-containing protein [Zavarzinella sp.]
MKLSFLSRKLHRWGSILTAAPVLLVLITGILLHFKKESAWLQPPTQKGKGNQLQVSFDTMLAKLQEIPQAEVKSWEDVERLDVRPDKGIIKIKCQNSWEIQLHGTTGEVLQVAYRRSDFVEQLHDGTFFSESVRWYIFVPTGLILIGLWFTGIHLFVLPHWVKWRRKKST